MIKKLCINIFNATLLIHNNNIRYLKKSSADEPDPANTNVDLPSMAVPSPARIKKDTKEETGIVKILPQVNETKEAEEDTKLQEGNETNSDEQLMDKQHELLEKMLERRIDAYSSFEVMSSLLFGFAVSILFGGVFDEEIWEDFEVLQTIFVIGMCFVMISSALSTIIISMSHYIISRYMADHKFVFAMLYVQTFRNLRYYARLSMYSGIIVLIITLGVYTYPQVSLVSAIAMIVMLVIGTVILIVVLYVLLHPEKYLDFDKLSQMEIQQLLRSQQKLKPNSNPVNA